MLNDAMIKVWLTRSTESRFTRVRYGYTNRLLVSHVFDIFCHPVGASHVYFIRIRSEPSKRLTLPAK